MSVTSTGEPTVPVGAKRRRSSRWFHPDIAGVVAVVVGVVLANWSYLFGVTNPNPLATTSGIGTITKGGLLPGIATIDPNVGFTSQALGRLAGHYLLHGQSVWWNPIEALGMPLAGEMQSAALFPLTPLLVLPNGQLYFHVLLELIAGLCTYALLRCFAIAWPIAVAGAIAFACNGTFAWLANAVVNPIAFLPMILLGVELARDRSINQRRGGWYLITAGIALSLYAGFPEVAYLNSLLVAVWTIGRLATVGRANLLRFVAKLAAGAATGLMIAAPIIIAFTDFLHVGTAGSHNASSLGHVSLPPGARPALLMPYIYGGIHAYLKAAPGLGVFWGSVGGFLTTSTLVLALIGVFGSKERVLRLVLAGWALFALSATYGFLGTHRVLNLLPVIKSVATYRYLPVSWEFALIILAAFGLSDLCAKRFAWQKVVPAAVLVGLLLWWSVRGASAIRLQIAAAGNIGHYATFQVVWPFVAVGVVAVGALALRGRVRMLVLSGVVALDAAIGFAIPTLSAPQQFVVDTAPIHFLQHHLGQQRFFTLGPIQPNYGSYFDIASINANDLPVAKDFDLYVRHHLNSNQWGYLFTPGARIVKTGIAGAAAFTKNMANYEAAGVKYVVTGPRASASKWFHAIGLRVVFHDSVATIAILPKTHPYLSVGPNCSMVISSRTEVTTYCTQPSTVTRLEMSLPGSGASVNARPVPITIVGDAFEKIDVPAGVSYVSFSYVPPRMGLGYLAFWLGVAFLFFSALWAAVSSVIRRRRGAATQTSPPTPQTPVSTPAATAVLEQEVPPSTSSEEPTAVLEASETHVSEPEGTDDPFWDAGTSGASPEVAVDEVGGDKATSNDGP